MCRFLSIITRGDGIPLFIDLEKRKSDPYNGNLDSHSCIAEKFIKESELKNFDKLKGKCDIVNSYEIDFQFDGDYKITNYNIKIDTINIGDDLKLLKKNIENLLPEFNEIVKYHFWDRFVESPKIDANLNLSFLPIRKLPENLIVGGDLNLRSTEIKELPENLTVSGDLDLRYTLITELPENLQVGGNLYLYNTLVTELPENLQVGGGLDLSFTPIIKLPENLTVSGDLDLRYTLITELPENLQVGGDLYLSNTPITKLPENLQVGGGLDLNHTSIIELPNNLKVGSNLHLNKSNFNQEIFVKPIGIMGDVYFS